MRIGGVANLAFQKQTNGFTLFTKKCEFHPIHINDLLHLAESLQSNATDTATYYFYLMSIARTPAKSHIYEYEEKKSRFVAYLARINSDSDFKNWLAGIRGAHPKASHHCWAYILGMPNNAHNWNQSDDGEPKGTAGKPMLNVLTHNDVGECAVVIARYFGGIKLGAGGLVRAYSTATKLVLDTAEWQPLENKIIVQLTTNYQEINQVQRWLQGKEITPTDQIFGEQAKLDLAISESLFDEFESFVEDLRNTYIKMHDQ